MDREGDLAGPMREEKHRTVYFNGENVDGNHCEYFNLRIKFTDLSLFSILYLWV